MTAGFLTPRPTGAKGESPAVRSGRRAPADQRPAPVVVPTPNSPSEPSAAGSPTLGTTPSWKRVRGATLVSFVRSPRTGSSATSVNIKTGSPQKSTWGVGERFQHTTGWTRAKVRDEQAFQHLASKSMKADSSAAAPSGKSRFVVERADMDRSPPGVVHARACTAEGMGLTQAILKVPGRMVITPRDANGDAVVASEADVFRIQIRG